MAMAYDLRGEPTAAKDVGACKDASQGVDQFQEQKPNTTAVLQSPDEASATGKPVTVDMGTAPAAAPAVSSIYDLYSAPRKVLLLFLVFFCCLIVPMTDTIYIPSLEQVKADLHCSQAMAALSVAVYMLGAGIMALIWGPLSDRWGRRVCYALCSVLYISATLGCMFSPNAGILVFCRTLQGGSVTGFMAGGAGIVADVFPPKQRGVASAIFSLPMLVGPVIGPIVGGAVGHRYGWRGSFLVLVVYAALIMLAVLFLLRHETHQYYALQRIQQQQGDAAASAVTEAAEIRARKPHFRPPWAPLGFLIERNIFPYIAPLFILFGSMFSTLIVLPSQLTMRPYTLPSSAAGVTYTPVAVGCFLAAPFGGILADKAANRFAPHKQGRMLPSLTISGFFAPIGLVIYGWTLQYKQVHLAWVLLGHACVGAGTGIYMPAIYSYLSVLKQQAASAASSGVQALNLVVAGVLIQVSALAVDAMGAGPFFSLLAGLILMSISCTELYTWHLLRSTRQLPVAGDIESGSVNTADAADVAPNH